MGRIKRGSALAAACMLLFLAAVPREARGAAAIETDKKDCSMTFSLSGGFEELNSRPVSSTVWRIAGVNGSGEYQPEADYSGIGLEEVSAATTAEQWESMAREAAGIAAPGVLDEEGTVIGKDFPVGDGQITLNEANGGDTLEDLKTGMYLVLTSPVDTAEYTYFFAPYLVSVPGNAYDGQRNMDDTWIYDVEVILKPQRENRLGSLVIEKTIDTYQPRGEADRTLFVFQVEVRKTEEGAAGPEDRLYYSNVVALDFDAAGMKSLEIPDLPAGAVATVTEVYSGVSYTIPAGEATVRSEPVVADGRVSVSFTNQYNGSFNGGSGVVNHFEHNGATWSHKEQ